MSYVSNQFIPPGQIIRNIISNLRRAIAEFETTTQVDVNPSSSISINSTGIGQIMITFARSVPQALQKYATGPNTVIIPVHGKLTITGLNGVSQITPINVTVNVNHQITGVTPSAEVKITPSHLKYISVTVSNNSVTSITIDGKSVSPTSQLILYIGCKGILATGYGTYFTISGYDPLAGVPVLPRQNIALLNGSSSTYASISPHISNTGYIMIDNIAGDGRFDIFLIDILCDISQPVIGYPIAIQSTLSD